MILFVDDEPRRIEEYVDELIVHGYDVRTTNKIDAALALLRAKAPEVEAVILDVMMPPGQSFSSTESENGLLTGVLAYRRIRSYPSGGKIPLILLTNSMNSALDDMVQQDPLAWLARKSDFFSDELADFVNEKIKLVQ